jgi:RHS repeat-associated protein
LIEVQYRPDATGTYSTAFLYGYDGDGNLAYSQDVRTSTAGITRYDYDLTGRLMKSERFNGSGALVSTYCYEYDLNDNLAKIKQTVANRSWDVTYSYDGDNRPVSVVSSGMATVTDAYDTTLGLRTSRTYAFASPFTVNFSYIINGDGTKTALLAGYQNGTDSAYAYTYDENGNITQISKGGTTATYVYDKANQLIRENDGFSGKTWTYSYDKFGNMLEKVEYDYTTGDPVTPLNTINYGYSTGEWKDQLVSYDGQTIAYDAMGNPTTYLGETLTWTDGRKLASYGTTASYVYDKEGMRVQKTVGANVTDFYYNGSLLLGQKTGTVAQYYTYDASGNLLAIYYNGAYYYYLRNGQGDITGLMDGTGAVVVSYSYDAWGKPLATTGTLATTLGADNPFRYRGYYYDTEIGLYYLKSRYYDPDTCRFLNGDVLMSTGQGIVGSNMYAYCGNNPIILKDSFGLFPINTMLTKNEEGAGERLGADQTNTNTWYGLSIPDEMPIDKRIEKTVEILPQKDLFFASSETIIAEGTYDADSSYNWVIGGSDNYPIMGTSQYIDDYFYSFLPFAGKDTSSVEFGHKTTSWGISVYRSVFDFSFSFDTTIYTGNMYTRVSNKIKVSKLSVAAALLAGAIEGAAVALDFAIPLFKLHPAAR